MAEDTPKNSGPRNSIKAPLVFAFSLACVAGLVTLFAGSGGTNHGLRWDLGGVAFGIAFVASLLVASLLTLSYKENPDHLGKGSGVNLRSQDRLKGIQQAMEQAAAQQREAALEADGAPEHDGGTPPAA